MTRPDDIPVDIWNAADEALTCGSSAVHKIIEQIARAIMAAKEGERDQIVALMADRRSLIETKRYQIEKLNAWVAKIEADLAYERTLSSTRS